MKKKNIIKLMASIMDLSDILVELKGTSEHYSELKNAFLILNRVALKIAADMDEKKRTV